MSLAALSKALPSPPLENMEEEEWEGRWRKKGGSEREEGGKEKEEDKKEEKEYKERKEKRKRGRRDGRMENGGKRGEKIRKWKCARQICAQLTRISLDCCGQKEEKVTYFTTELKMTFL